MVRVVFAHGLFVGVLATATVPIATARAGESPNWPGDEMPLPITVKTPQDMAFKSVAELKSAIIEYLDNHNADPKPFVWTKSAGQILEKVARAKQALESQHYLLKKETTHCGTGDRFGN